MYKLTTLTIILLVILQKSTKGDIVNTVNGNPVNGTTISIETSTCPFGQISNGNSCVQACPCGYNYDATSHRCFPKETITKTQCPPGFHHEPQTHRCIENQIAITPTSCSFGYTFIGNKCVLSCPIGYVLDAYKHVCRRSMPTYSGACPAGQGWNGQKCLPKTLPLGCPTGYKLENGKCIKKHYGAMICPDNHIVDPKNPNQCISKVSLLPQCPDDFIFVNNRCEKLIKNAMTCPAGYTLNGGVCTKTEISDLSICPTNFYLENNRCVQKSVATGECPLDTERVGDTCIKRAQGVLMCDYGYVLKNNECVKFEKTVLHCSLPYTLVNGQCVLSVKLE